ncbi:hypothetical protein Gotur_033386 [Gossypium turneri]
MDSAMLASLKLPTVKADLRTSVSVLIANIRSQIGYTPSYRKAWIAKQKALEKMYSGWDASYNEIWLWCQVLERYVYSSAIACSGTGWRWENSSKCVCNNTGGVI